MEITFTEVEHRILQVTADGKPHKRDEILACMEDELATTQALHQALHRLRQKISHLGQDLIVQSFGRKHMYRRVRFLNPIKVQEPVYESKAS